MTEEDKQNMAKAAQSIVDFAELGARLFNSLLPFPKDSLKHLIEAQKELLLAGRSLIDGAISTMERLENEQQKQAEKETAKKVNIQ